MMVQAGASLKQIRKLLHRVALLLGLIVAVGAPLLAGVIDFSKLKNNLIFRADVISSQISAFANIQGKTWPYSSHRLPELVTIGDPSEEFYVVVDYVFGTDVREGIAVGTKLDDRTSYTVTVPVMLRSEIIGYVRITASLVDTVLLILEVFLLSGFMGILTYTLFFQIPMRVVGRSVDALAQSRERLKHEIQQKNTALQRTEIEAERAREASNVKSRFLAHMSHEMRTPLNAIIGFSDIMKNEMLGPIQLAYLDYANDINNSGLHLLGLVNALLDLAKIEQNKAEVHIEEVVLERVLEDAIRLVSEFARKQSIRIDLNVAGNVPATICSDRSKLLQSLVNVLSNSVKYTPEGGSVEIGVFLNDVSVEIVIEDNGIGMSEDDLTTALEPFGQVNNPLTSTTKGTGLGLPISREFIALMGGRFDIFSEVGVGTKVTISIPAEHPSAIQRNAIK